MITQRIHANGGAAVLRWPVWIGIVCDDLESQRHFYRDVLGLKELKSGEDFVWFDFDGKLLELLAKSPLPQYDRRRVRSPSKSMTSTRRERSLSIAGLRPSRRLREGRRRGNTGPTLRMRRATFLNWYSD